MSCGRASTSAAQSGKPIDAYVAAHQQAIIGELVELLSIPNVAADRDNIRRNADHLRGLFLKRGFAVEILETSGNPLVFAELRTPGAQRTILFYAHYDGQPVNPKGWNQQSPFVPVLRSRRMEDGGEDIANFLDPEVVSRRGAPLRALGVRRQGADRRAARRGRCVEVGEPAADVERQGDSRRRRGSALAGSGRDDGPLQGEVPRRSDADSGRSSAPSGKPTLSFGARGNLVFQLTTFGPKFALHSGHYGNWAPNPALDLAQLLASMKDANGRVLDQRLLRRRAGVVEPRRGRFWRPCPIGAKI